LLGFDWYLKRRSEEWAQLSVKFTAGIDFKSGLFGKGFSQADLRHFCASVSLPRHVAIISM